MDEPPFALVCGWRYPLLIIAKGGSFSTVSTLRLYSSTSIACGFLYEQKSTTHFCAALFFLVEITGIEPVTSCMPCKRSPEPRTHAPPHKGAGMIDIRRYNALFRERRILTQKQLCCLNEFY